VKPDIAQHPHEVPRSGAALFGAPLSVRLNPQPFSLSESGITAENETLVLDLAPASLNMAWFPVLE
jgi:hypothetical protein